MRSKAKLLARLLAFLLVGGALLLFLNWALAPKPIATFAGVELFASPDQLRLAPGGATLTILHPEEPLRLRLVSHQPLASLTVDLSRQAPSQLEVTGGEVGLRLFRPDGTILYQLMLDSGQPVRRWRVGPKRLCYSVELTLVGAKPSVAGEGEIELLLTVERVASPPPPPASTEPRA